MESNEGQIAVEGTGSVKESGGRKPRAAAVIIADLCTGCQICIPSCPVNCISIRASELNFNGIGDVGPTCTGCNICAIDCPWNAIVMLYPDGTRKEPAEYDRQLKRLRGYQ
jgi:Pyruvate/2-oxoacid:ferredoxin oxidoreductase delta subunit